jgi:hypothetical protein
MQRKPVKSGAIAEVGYDRATKTLEIAFPSKAVWQYFDVPPEVYVEFGRSESLGRYFAMNIRANYKAERVHIKECDEYALDNCSHECLCWCHKLTKSSDGENHGATPNPDLEKDLKKSIRQAGQKKAVQNRATRNRET